MGDPWQDEGFVGDDAGGDDWDEGKESIEADLEEELGEDELEDESWEDDEDEE